MKAKISIRFYFLLLVLVFASAVTTVWYLHRPNFVKNNTPPIILISIDTCRADHLSCYGYSRPTTPNIDELAKTGTLFTNVITPIPITLPAHCSMLTGMIPPCHGVHFNMNQKLPSSKKTLAKILFDAGYKTAAVTGAFVLDSQFGLDQGFEIYNDTFLDPIEVSTGVERRAGEVSQFGCEYLEKFNGTPFFLFLHFYDPHHRYEPPEPYATTYAETPYAGEIAYTDQCIGEIVKKLKELGLYDSALIIITGDHGESLGEHGEDYHAYFIYQSNIKVPLVIKTPGQDNPQRIDTPVGLIDIVPTILGYLGIDIPDDVQGTDLSINYNKKIPSDKERYRYCESLTATQYDCSTLRGVVGSRWKYIQAPRPELYDLISDPAEMNNLAKIRPGKLNILEKHLKEILISSSLSEPSTQSRLPSDTENLERLRSLGYVGTGVDEDSMDFDSAKPDPKDFIDFYQIALGTQELITDKKFQQAKIICQKMVNDHPDFPIWHLYLGKIAFSEGNASEAVGHLIKCIELDSDDVVAQMYLGMAYIQLGEYEKAADNFNKILEQNPHDYKAQSNLASALFSQEKYDQAVIHFKKMLLINPKDPMTINNLGFASYKLGKIDEAVAFYYKALEIDPQLQEAHYNLAQTLIEQNKIMPAIEHYEKLLQINPDLFAVHNELAYLYYQQGKFDKSINHWKTALDINPDDPSVHANLARTLIQTGELEQALQHFEHVLRLDPKNQPKTYNDFGLLLAQHQQQELAITYFKQAIKIDPQIPQAHFNLGLVLADQGNFEQAIDQWEKTIELKSDWPEALNQLAWTRATHPDVKLRNPQEAVRLALRACELTRFESPQLLDTLAAAYAAEGKYDEAVETSKKAINLAQSTNQNQLAQQIKSRLEIYMRNQPYFDSSQ